MISTRTVNVETMRTFLEPDQNFFRFLLVFDLVSYTYVNAIIQIQSVLEDEPEARSLCTFYFVVLGSYSLKQYQAKA